MLIQFLFIFCLALCSQYGAAAFASPSIPPPPPLSMPVWSLSAPLDKTADEDLPSSMKSKGNDRHSMNIVTFATAVSVAPPKIWAVSLYTNTLTRRAFLLDAKVGVLQLLRPDQSKLVPTLGKRSGYEDGCDKRGACNEAGFEWVSYYDGNENDFDESTCSGSSEGDANAQYEDAVRLQVLPGCATYIKVKVLSYHNAGDHDVALCEVLDTAMWNDDEKKVVSCSSDDKEGKLTVPAFDPSTALYTGQLREEGII